MYENDYWEITLYLRVQCICTSSAGLNVPAPHRNISKSNVNPPKAPHKRKKEKKKKTTTICLTSLTKNIFSFTVKNKMPDQASERKS